LHPAPFTSQDNENSDLDFKYPQQKEKKKIELIEIIVIIYQNITDFQTDYQEVVSPSPVKCPAFSIGQYVCISEVLLFCLSPLSL
jgi:hypothetical protein